MKRISNWTVVALLTFSSCAHEFTYDPTQEINENAQSIFGIIDPNQDWNNITSGTVSITANADLDNITKVQILTESPFFNDQAKIIAEAEATAGQTVTLSYDAPRSNTRLIAACVDNNGKYYIKGFNIEEKEVSFSSSSTPATTRGLGITRAASVLPDLSNVSLNFNESFLSYNALRTLSNDSKYSSWIGKNWENDRLWLPTGSGTSNGWTISNSTIYTDAPILSDEDSATLKDIFDASLYRYTKNDKPRNNLEYINESSTVKLFGNHLESNGKTALTLCPVQVASTEAYWCDIYYYYYRPEDIPAGTTEPDYIKTLPKFKAIDLYDERQALKDATGTELDARSVKFFRMHEYLLPFYGNASEFKLLPPALSAYGYTTNGKFYRIYNDYGNPDKGIAPSKQYITYDASSEKNLQDEYTSNIEYQLWQIFTNANDNKVMLYNVGIKKFLWFDAKNYVYSKDIAEKSLDYFTFNLTDKDRNIIEFDSITNQKVYIYSYNKNKCIKAMIDVNRKYMYNGNQDKNGAREWTIEEYNNYSGSASKITDFELPSEYYSTNRIAPPSQATSAIIPEGYRIGFMIRKDNGDRTANIDNDKHGCLYGYGELNTEINTYGQFNNAVGEGKMNLNSPRMATFEANNKVYLCFEEGADTQYSDVIVEIGSRGEPGIYMFDDVPETANMPYTMCFEDRPNVADYDMNDVALRCVRKSATELELSLIATGANDQVYIYGINGDCTSGTDLNGKEAHALFGVSTDVFVNTETSAEVHNAITATYQVSESTTIPQFLSNIYIKNISRGGEEIHVPKKGEAPFALIIPGDFDYPAERISIVNAYTTFQSWANNANNYAEWLNSFVSSKIYTNPYNRSE